MVTRNSIVGVVLLLIVTAALAAQSIDEGDPHALRAWLDGDADRPEYVDVLLRLLDLAPDLDTFTSDLGVYAERVVLDADRARLYAHAGRVYETANRFPEAARWYARAIASDAEDWDSAIRRAAMSMETGEVGEAIVLLGRAIQGAPTRTLQRRAAILRVRAFLLTEEYDRAYQHAAALVGEAEGGSVEAAAVLALYEVAGAIDRQEVADRARTILEEIAPESLELAIIKREATFLPSPSRIFPSEIAPAVPAPTVQSTAASGEARAVPRPAPASRVVRGIQVGSFRDPENARYMRIDIENLGFDAAVEEYRIDGELYHRVLVPISDGTDEASVQTRVLALKERGIEGMLLFGETR